MNQHLQIRRSQLALERSSVFHSLRSLKTACHVRGVLPSSSGRIALLVALAAGFAAGCTVVADPHPAVYAEVDVAPVNIETYPTTVYEGHPVYYYGDRWYYQRGQRWGYYREEPAELQRHRRIIQHAPPAPRGREPQGPPGRGRESAPPADRR